MATAPCATFFEPRHSSFAAPETAARSHAVPHAEHGARIRRAADRCTKPPLCHVLPSLPLPSPPLHCSARHALTVAHPVAAEMLERLEEMQLKDTLRMFNGLVERCFSECVTGFRSKALTAPEEKCVTTCANKYLKHSVGLPFARAAHRCPRSPPT